MQLFSAVRPSTVLVTHRPLPNLDPFLMPQSTPRARKCRILLGRVVGGGATHGSRDEVLGATSVRPPSLWGRWRLAIGPAFASGRDRALDARRAGDGPGVAGHQRQPVGDGLLDRRHRLARPHARPEGRMGHQAGRAVARGHQPGGRGRRGSPAAGPTTRRCSSASTSMPTSWSTGRARRSASSSCNSTAARPTTRPAASPATTASSACRRSTAASCSRPGTCRR